MKIYISHSTSFDYAANLYKPLRRAFGDVHQLMLPHEAGVGINSKQSIISNDFILAEVSYPSTGQGIELGWADDAITPILCFHKSDTEPSSALRHIARDIVSYDSEEDMMQKFTQALSSLLHD